MHQIHDRLKELTSIGVLVALGLTIIVFAVPASGGPSGAHLLMQYLAPALGVGLLILTIKAHTRDDLAPDYLRRMFRKRFDCNGLGLAVECEDADGVAYVQLYFQNRHERPCQAQVTIRRRHGMAVTKAGREFVSVHLSARGGAFGLVRVPVPVPAKLQGRRKAFEICGETNWPSGCGRLLRFHPGRRIGADDSSAGAVTAALIFGSVLGAAAAASSSAAYFKMRYPRDAAETLEKSARVETEILWEPGDEVINAVELQAAAE